MRTLLVFASAVGILLASPSAGFSQDTLDGEWMVTINSPLGPVEFPVTIVQEGESLSATTPPGPDGAFTFTGTVQESRVRFEFETDYEGAALPITLTGGVTAGQMAGPADFGGLAVGDWSALRSEDD